MKVPSTSLILTIFFKQMFYQLCLDLHSSNSVTDTSKAYLMNMLHIHNGFNTLKNINKSYLIGYTLFMYKWVSLLNNVTIIPTITTQQAHILIILVHVYSNTFFINSINTTRPN
ncbi:hypothetical protein GDO81_008352 [Engystomops pustulosus]|uniref:Uncharacterized protein n=1 Tax=Engystomops pustulosus TaxID=76066 RepID=A0AAV7CEA0_ENGPU|nr:hypothetical protein GDO81_008352 [Engystomops pustulosus]